MTLEDVPREWLLAVVAAAFVFVVWTWIRGVIRRASLRWRFDRAADGEREAAVLLEDQGFAIESVVVVGGYTLDGALLVDAEALRIHHVALPLRPR